MHHVYTGNVHDPEGETTYCAACSAPLIRRDRYTILGAALDDEGHCRACGERCPGVFDGPPGTWGRRRRPVRLGFVEPDAR
jgi:pyruvate formate lyase activating enzyme